MSTRLGFHGDRVVVDVPATSANLGPGFDSFGLALGLFDELRVSAVPEQPRLLDIVVEGEGADCVPTDETHLVVRTMHTTFDAMGLPRPGLRLHCRNRVPHARGLGSSAAAIVGGVLAARALVARPDPSWDKAWVLRLAAEAEGHPDNVAACVYGGMTVAWMASDGARAVRLELSDLVLPVVLVPPQELSTATVRGLLPATVAHRDAARTVGRAGLLVAALTTGRSDVLLDATQDWLHQPYRSVAMPDSWSLIERLRARGVAAVISGAGPTVLAFTDPSSSEKPLLSQLPDGWWAPRVKVSSGGASAHRAASSVARSDSTG